MPSLEDAHQRPMAHPPVDPVTQMERLTRGERQDPFDPLQEVVEPFQGLPHRMQKVAELQGVVFFDDSKGTNVGATAAALAGVNRPVVLIAGGEGKGQDFAPLAPAVKAHARTVVLIGRDADRIARALAGSGVPVVRAGGMEEAVAAASRAARSAWSARAAATSVSRAFRTCGRLSVSHATPSSTW